MTQDKQDFTEEQKILLAEARMINSSLMGSDYIPFWGEAGDKLRTQVIRKIVRQCLEVPGIKFRELAGEVAIKLQDLDLLKAVLPRIDLESSRRSEALVQEAVKLHDPAYYTAIREYWKTIEPKVENDEDYRSNWHLRFCDAAELAFSYGTPEVFDVVHQEFDSWGDLPLVVKRKNWVLLDHILDHYLHTPETIVQLTNLLRGAGQPQLLEKVLKLGFQPDISRDPYENIIDLVPDSTFEEMLKDTDKILALPQAAGARLVSKKMFTRVEAVLSTQWAVPAHKRGKSQNEFIRGVVSTAGSLRKEGDYGSLERLLSLTFTYFKGEGLDQYCFDSFITGAIVDADTTAIELFHQAGYTPRGSFSAILLPQEGSVKFVQYLSDKGYYQLKDSLISRFLDFNGREDTAREEFYLRAVEAGLLNLDHFDALIHPQRTHSSQKVITDIVLNRRTAYTPAQLFHSIPSQYLTVELLKHFLAEDQTAVFQDIALRDRFKRYVAQNKVDVIKELISAGYELRPSERSGVTKSKNEAMIAVLPPRKKNRKNKKQQE